MAMTARLADDTHEHPDGHSAIHAVTPRAPVDNALNSSYHVDKSKVSRD